MGVLQIGRSGLGYASLSGISLDPLPAARIAPTRFFDDFRAMDDVLRWLLIIRCVGIGGKCLGKSLSHDQCRDSHGAGIKLNKTRSITVAALKDRLIKIMIKYTF